MEDLIFNRLLSDVSTALNNPDNSNSLKGAYNYTDLNRVEKWCEYLYTLFLKYGFNKSLNIKTDWNMTDFPTRTQIDRIRRNIETLKSFCTSILTETIIYNNTLNYEQANVLEKVLYDIYQYYLNLQRQIFLPYNFGTTLIHNKFVNLTVDTETTTEEHKLSLNTGVGLALVRQEYIILKIKEE